MALPVGVPALGRYSIRKIAEFLTLCEAVAVSVAKLKLLSDGKDKSLRMTGKVEITCGADVAVYDVADSGGAVRNFGAADDAVKALCVEAGLSGVAVEVTVGTLWDKAIPSDLIADKKRRRATLEALKLKAQTRVTKLAAELLLMDGWETGSLAQQARKAETGKQKGSLDADVISFTAEIDAITAAVGA
jgi:hypothetical protein